MSLASMLVEDVTILRAGTTTDRYGNTTKNWATATSTTVKGRVEQSSHSEDAEGREAQVSTWRAFFHPDAVIAGGDRVQWEGITFEVDGPPAPEKTPRGQHHYRCTLGVVTG